jgi:hypothetical protein
MVGRTKVPCYTAAPLVGGAGYGGSPTNIV